MTISASMKKFVFFLPVPRDAILCPCSACTLSVDGLVKCVDWRCPHQQPIGRALSMGPFESEDGSAATGQMVMRSFTSSFMYVPPKKVFSLRVTYVLHRMYIDVLHLNCVVLVLSSWAPQLRTRCA